MPSASPSKLGKYELLFELAGSGVATSWIARAEDDTSEKPRLYSVLRLHRHVAKNVDVAEAFLKEARHAQKLKHPNVLPIVETGIGDGEVFIVSDHVEGDTLAALTLQSGATGLPPGVVLRIALDVLGALDVAHGLSPEPLFHGELSPWNVLVGVDGVARVMLFGVARVLAKVGSHGVKNQERLGYAAPERVKAMAATGGAPAPDAKSDLFSVGVMLWEGLAKQRLFASKIEAAVIQKVLTSPIPALGSVAGVTVDASIGEAVARLLAREPAKRTAGAMDVIATLEAAGAAASPTAVGELVEKLCGKALAARRAELAAALVRPKNSTPPPKAPSAPRARAGTLLGIPVSLGPLPDVGLEPKAASASTSAGPAAAGAAKAPISPPPPAARKPESEGAASPAKSPSPPVAANGRPIKPRASTLLGVSPGGLPKPAPPVRKKEEILDEVSIDVDPEPAKDEATLTAPVAPNVTPAPPPRKPFLDGKISPARPEAPKAGPKDAPKVDEAAAKKPGASKPTPSPTSTPGGAIKQRGVQAMAIDRIGPGSTLGRYEVLMPVAKGGMAAVWAARIHGTRGFQKIVALKTMLPDVSDDPDFETMFLDEARVAARIRHPNVVEIMDLGEENDVLYIVMEWVEGETVGTLQKASKPLGGIPVPILLRIASQCCAGLHAAHELRDENDNLVDLVHRDISPANVLVSISGFVKIVDFGIAKSKARMHVTQVGGAVKGKTPYLSPEQLGGLPVDRRSDLFSLGAMLYVLATGLHPFRGETEIRTIENIALKPALPPKQIAPTVPDELDRIILKALEKEPGKRFATAGEMQRAIDALASSIGAPVTDEDVAAFVKEVIGDSQTKRAAELKAAISAIEADSGRASAASLELAAAAAGVAGPTGGDTPQDAVDQAKAEAPPSPPADAPGGSTVQDHPAEPAAPGLAASSEQTDEERADRLADDDELPFESPQTIRRRQVMKLAVAGVVAGLAILGGFALLSGGSKPTTPIGVSTTTATEAAVTPPPAPTESAVAAQPTAAATPAAAETAAPAPTPADVAAAPTPAPTPDLPEPPAPPVTGKPKGASPHPPPTPKPPPQPKPAKPPPQQPKPKKFDPKGI